MNKQNLKSVGMWLLPMLLFTGQFVLRLWPSLMMKDIMQQFSIDATNFGVLASAYYYGYAGMQIPLAIAIERFGVRTVAAVCTIVVGLSVLLFVNTQSWPLALLARFLIGAGSGAGILSVSKVASQWFSKESYTKMIGYTFTVGLTGAIYGGRPMNYLISSYGGHVVWSAAGAVAIALGVIIFAFLRSPVQTESAEEPLRMRDFKALLASRSIWLLAFANLLMVGLLEGFADVWGVNYLMTAFDFDKGNAAQLTSFIFVGMVFGGPLLAWVSQKYGIYRTICGCGIGMAFGLIGLLLGGVSNAVALTCLFFALGILCCYQVLVFSLGSQLSDPKRLGITIAFLNCINMLGGSYFHTVVGRIMDMLWSGTIEQGVRTYTLTSYQYGLSIIPISALVGTVLILFLSRQRN